MRVYWDILSCQVIFLVSSKSWVTLMSILQLNRVNLTWILLYLCCTRSTQLHRIFLGLCSHMEIPEDMTEGFAGEHPDWLREALPAVGHPKKASPSPAHHNSLRLGTESFTHILPLTRGMLCALCKCTHFFSVFTTNQTHFPLEIRCFYAVQYRNIPIFTADLDGQQWWPRFHVLLQHLHLQQQQ